MKKINDVWCKTCIVTGVNEFTSKKGNVMRQLFYLSSDGNVQKLFLSNDFDMSKVSRIVRFDEYVVSIVINGSFVSVVDIEHVK